MLDKWKQNKRLLPATFLLAAILLVAGMWYFSIKTTAYAVVIDGQERFLVKKQADVNQALQQLSQDNNRLNKKVDLSNKVEVKMTMANRKAILPSRKVKTELAKVVKFETTAVAIVINGKAVTWVENKAAANEVLSKLKKENARIENGEKLLSLRFQEEVKLKEGRATINQIKSNQQAYDTITTGSENPEKYEVKEGDSLWTIARRNDMYVDDIVKANHLKSENLDLGQELVLLKAQPYINVVAWVEGEKVETIPFQTKVVVDKKATSTVKIKQTGQNGERQIAYTVTRFNGVETQKTVKKETIIKAAVDKIIIKGTRVVQVASRGGGGSGSLDWPVYGPINSYYGSRGGSHTGVDIGARSGTAIRAANSGYVVSAEYDGGYGKLITIRHDNGLVTRYAHCSSMAVSAGDKVSRGETIGAVGSTGHSTGPHLHFEVRANGSFTDPLSYLR